MGNESINQDMSRHPLGTAEQLDDVRTTLTFVRHYRHPVPKVWAALTEPETLRAWLAEADGELKVGGAFNLRWLNGKDEDLQWWRGRILQAAPMELFVYTNAVHGLLRWELAADDGGAGCRLTFTNVVNAVGEQISMNLAGWHIHLDHLQEALEGRAVDWPHWWQDLFPAWDAAHQKYLAAAKP